MSDNSMTTFHRDVRNTSYSVVSHYDLSILMLEK